MDEVGKAKAEYQAKRDAVQDEIAANTRRFVESAERQCEQMEQLLALQEQHLQHG